jgi:hypothetical protein
MSQSDPNVPRGGESERGGETRGRAARAANLFDLRRIIGAVFLVWAVLLVILGITDSQAEIDKAAGININLYAGIGMLVVGLFFITWALMRPLGEELREAEGAEHPGRSAPRGVDAAALASHQRRGRPRRDRHRPGGQGGAGTE